MIFLLYAGNSTVDTWTALMNQVIKVFPHHTPRHTAIFYFIVFACSCQRFVFSQGKKFRYSSNYSEKQVRKAALDIVHKTTGIIIPQKKKALELLAV